MNSTSLKALSVAGQLLTAFPFVVCCEALSYGGYTWWHYFALYAVFGVFYILGRLCRAWAVNPSHSRSFRPKAYFLSRAAVAVPTILFVILAAVLGLSSGLYIYALPAAVIMYFAGYGSYDKGYADIFTRGWFGFFFVAAVVCSLLLLLVQETEVRSFGIFQLCFSFGVLIVIAAVLTNQTNIDLCTRQRDSGRTVLPKGLRGYNGALVAAVVSVAVLLFLLTGPVAKLLSDCGKWLARQIFGLLQSGSGTYTEGSEYLGTSSEGGAALPLKESPIASLLSFIFIVVLVVVVLLLMKHILRFIKGLFSPLFRIRDEESDDAYTDEITDTDAQKSRRSMRKLEQQLYKRFRSETDPQRKYRTGYRFMLLRLCDTPFPPAPTDNTDIHSCKGVQGFGYEEIPQLVSVYNSVRYNNAIPTEDEINQLQCFVEAIRRKL